MSTLIPTVSLTKFRNAIKKLKADQLRQLKSMEIMADGEILFYLIVPPINGGMTITDHIRTKAEYLGVQGNAVGGKEMAEFLSEAENATV
jgi:hypothetical protein